MNRPLNIAIAGCGIGGLAAAVFLRRAGHAVTLYDQFAAPAPVGSGLVIQPVGQEVLARLGVLDAALSKGAPIYQMIGHEAASGREVLNVHYGPRGRESFGLGIHRAALFECLLVAARGEGLTIRASHEITETAITPKGRTLSFTNGQTSPAFDLVIDTSGAGSPLSPLRAKPTRYGAIWGTVDWPQDWPSETVLPRDKLSQRYRRASHMMGVLPIGTLPDDDAPKAAVFWSLPQDKYE
ncbi:MAG: FAD-dependent oxidoreductase, partial [Maricaulaceae bacterium]